MIKSGTSSKITFVCGWENCSYCDTLTLSFDKHVSSHMPDLGIGLNEDGEDTYVCKWLDCGFETQNVEEVKRHVKFHSYHTRLKARGTEIIEKKNLPACTFSDGERNLVPSQTEPLICQWENCGEISSGQQEFIDHLVKSHLLPYNKNDGFFVCLWSDCGSSVTKKEKLMQHVRSHTGERVVACPNCGQMFANNTKFSDHCNRQLPIDDGSYQCDLCLSYFPTERILKLHMRQHVHHYKCPFCDLTCSRPSVIARHIRYRHLNYRPFKCNSCPYSCKSQSDLRSHLLTHNRKLLCSEPDCDCTHKQQFAKDFERNQNKERNGNRGFACHLCNKKYTRGVKLTAHLLSVHNVSKPSGYSRFIYRYDQDGYHRLQTVRLESLEVTEDMEKSLNKKGSEHLLSYEEDPDDVEHIEDEDFRNQTDYITIDVLDETGQIIKSETVLAGNTTLPPEAKVVAVAP